MIVNALYKWAIIEIPRTGTKSLREALLQIPGTFVYGNHNEVSTLPKAFEEFTLATVVRDPVHRLHSLYRYLSMDAVVNRHKEWFTPLHREVTEMSFSEWILDGKALFCGGAWPYSVAHQVPEQNKSQSGYYAHPDYLVEAFPHENLFSANSERGMREDFCTRILRGHQVKFRWLNASMADGHTRDPYDLLTVKAAEKIRCIDADLYATIYYGQLSRLPVDEAA